MSGGLCPRTYASYAQHINFQTAFSKYHVFIFCFLLSQEFEYACHKCGKCFSSIFTRLQHEGECKKYLLSIFLFLFFLFFLTLQRVSILQYSLCNALIVMTELDSNYLEDKGIPCI